MNRIGILMLVLMLAGCGNDCPTPQSQMGTIVCVDGHFTVANMDLSVPNSINLNDLISVLDKACIQQSGN